MEERKKERKKAVFYTVAHEYVVFDFPLYDLDSNEVLRLLTG